MRSWKKLSQKEYDSIKMLLTAGVKHSVIVRTLNRADSTITKIKKSRTFEEYLQGLRDEQNRSRKQTPIQEPVTANPAKGSTIEYITEGQQLLTVLTRIADELYTLTDAVKNLETAWENKLRKGLFS